MTVVNYSVQDIFDATTIFVGPRLVPGNPPLPRGFTKPWCASCSSPAWCLLIEIPLGVVIALTMPRKRGWGTRCLVLMALPLLIPWNVVGTIWSDFPRPDIGLLGHILDHTGDRLRLSDGADRRLGHGHDHGRLALDAAGGAARLCRPALDPRRLLPGGQDRRRLALGRLPLHPAARRCAACCRSPCCCASWTAS